MTKCRSNMSESGGWVLLSGDRNTVHLATVGVLRDDKMGTIRERLYRPVCRMLSRDPIIPIPIQTISNSRNLQTVNPDIPKHNVKSRRSKRRPVWQIRGRRGVSTVSDPEQYFASGRGVDESGIFRAKWTDIVTRAELGEVSSYLTTHEVYPEIKRVLTDLPNIPTREFAVVDLLKAYPSERRVLYRACTAALAMQHMPPRRRRFPVDALFRATKNAKL